MKQQALSFTPSPGTADVYVFRPYNLAASGVLHVVTVDAQGFGRLATKSYIFGELPPGKHALRVGNFQDKFHGDITYSGVFTFEANKCYFFMIKRGWLAVYFKPMSANDGQKYARQFKLSGDNWLDYPNKTKQTQ